MKQVDIPGGKATLRETDDLRTRDRQLIKAAAMASSSVLTKMTEAAGSEDGVATAAQAMAADSSLTWQEWLRFLEFRQAVVVAQLASWSRPEPLPTMSNIGTLEPDLFDALDEAVGGVPASAAETDFSPSPDPSEINPTGVSGASVGPSTDASAETSTPQSSSDSAPTSTESSSPA